MVRYATVKVDKTGGAVNVGIEVNSGGGGTSSVGNKLNSGRETDERGDEIEGDAVVES